MINFGTDGWRAVISDEFTFANVARVARAIAFHIIEHKLNKKPLIIGYDPRFLAEKFAETVARVMEGAGIDCLFAERDTPTPVIAWSVKDRKAAGAVMLTASHNPARYCGIKFIPEYAGPADTSCTTALQHYSTTGVDLAVAKTPGKIERFEPRERYFKYIRSLIDEPLLKQAALKVVYDPMHGSGRGYLDLLLQELGCQLEVLHGERDVLFGGGNPEPTAERLVELSARVKASGAAVGLANDGDADRFGVVDEQGTFLTANQVVALLFDYLLSRGYSGSVVRSVGTTHLIDRIAARHKVKVHETPVGFKYIAQIMLKEEVIIGGEESGGLSIKGHIPEKDGLLACLLACELIARRGKPLSALWQELTVKYGDMYDGRLNLHLSLNDKAALMEKLGERPPGELAGVKVAEVRRLDGVKLVLADGSWVLVRPSGTEPLVRFYVESDKPAKLAALLEACQNLL